MTSPSPQAENCEDGATPQMVRIYKKANEQYAAQALKPNENATFFRHAVGNSACTYIDAHDGLLTSQILNIANLGSAWEFHH
jgi:hypothetical protein